MSFVLLNNKKPSLISGNCKFLKKTTIQNAGREQGYPKKNLHEAMNQSTFKPSVASTALFPFNQS